MLLFFLLFFALMAAALELHEVFVKPDET